VLNKNVVIAKRIMIIISLNQSLGMNKYKVIEENKPKVIASKIRVKKSIIQEWYSLLEL